LGYTGHLIKCGKNQNPCGNFQVYYAEKYIDYAENTLDYAEIETIYNIIIVPFQCVYELLSEDPSSS